MHVHRAYTAIQPCGQRRMPAPSPAGGWRLRSCRSWRPPACAYVQACVQQGKMGHQEVLCCGSIASGPHKQAVEPSYCPITARPAFTCCACRSQQPQLHLRLPIISCQPIAGLGCALHRSQAALGINHSRACQPPPRWCCCGTLAARLRQASCPASPLLQGTSACHSVSACSLLCLVIEEFVWLLGNLYAAEYTPACTSPLCVLL